MAEPGWEPGHLTSERRPWNQGSRTPVPARGTRTMPVTDSVGFAPVEAEPMTVSRSRWSIQLTLLCGNVSLVLPDLPMFFSKGVRIPTSYFSSWIFNAGNGSTLFFNTVKANTVFLQQNMIWDPCGLTVIYLLDGLWLKHHPPCYAIKRQVCTKLSLSPQHHNSLQFFDYLKFLVSIRASFQMLSFKIFRRIAPRYLTKKTLSCWLGLYYPDPLFQNLQMLSVILPHFPYSIQLASSFPCNPFSFFSPDFYPTTLV